MSLTKERIEALCTDGMYSGVNGDQSEWAELRDLALKGIAPEAGAFSSCAGCEPWNLTCPKCGEPKGTGKCVLIKETPDGLYADECYFFEHDHPDLFKEPSSAARNEDSDGR